MVDQRLQDKPYLIDAIIGNSSILASLGANGRLYRLWWPHIDTPQHVDSVRVGLELDGTGTVTCFDDEAEGWKHQAAYVNRSNIFLVQATHDSYPLEVDSLHFVVPDKDLVVREYTFTNTGDTALSFSFLLYSSMMVCENPLYTTTMFDSSADALVHYKQQTYLAWGSPLEVSKFHAGIHLKQVREGSEALSGSQIDMETCGALSWRIEQLEPGESAVIPLYLVVGSDLEEAVELLNEARERTSGEWYEETREYWVRYLDSLKPCPLEDDDVRELYERSLLMFPLMSDARTGSIIAAPEFDEHFTRCGGYGYCWGRDAAFITTALDRAGLTQLSDQFYEWTLTAQSSDGSWQQRHYHDGSLAPSWGLQIDEGASIIWGMYQHYRHTGDESFVHRVWPAVRRGAEFLMRFRDEETGLPLPSKDLWEEREAIHTYSSAAVYGGLSAAAEFARLSGEEELAKRWMEAAERIRRAIAERCWNESRGCLYRGLRLTVDESRFRKAKAEGASGSVEELPKGYQRHVLDVDPVIDVSLIGVAVPFGALPADSEQMRQTADRVEEALTVPVVGGIKRYEDDPYIGGNPWILTTLWLAQYRIAVGELDEARELMRWAIEHRTRTGLLPEQVDKETGATAWVVPLTWSHAMFVLAVWMLADAGQQKEGQQIHRHQPIPS